VKNPANTHIVRHAGRYWALWEGGLPTEVTADLGTIGTWDYDGRIDGIMPALSAHPRLDPRTGEMFTFAYSPFAPYLRHFVMDAAGNLVHKIDIDLPAPVMMHDLLITEQHVVFLDSPIVLNIGSGDDGPVASWKPENGARLGVLPRMGTADQLRWFDIEPAHVQHFWNAWCDGDRIELRGARWKAVDFGYEAGGDEVEIEPAYPARFWIDLAAGQAGWEQLDDMGGEMCRFNDDVNGVWNRYDYMAAYREHRVGLGAFDAVAGYDAVTGRRQVWDFGGEREAGEPIFVPDPAGTDEGDGWVLCLANDRAATRTELHVFEAQRIDDGPMAVVRMPQRIPAGFHANWFADES
jgi:carotenoid cleavage dioxygenase